MSCVLSCALSAQDLIRVQFEIQVPPQFWGSDVYIAGNAQALGSWHAQGVPTEFKNKKYVASAWVTAGEAHEWKLNLGDWEHAEILINGTAKDNRVFACENDCTIYGAAENFHLKKKHPVPRTVTGNVRYHHDVYSEAFDNYRSIAVYLPPGYEESTISYPVVYALDGNNLFDKSTSTFGVEWSLDESAESLIKSGQIEPVIIVGIYNTIKRGDEYLFCRDKGYSVGGGARQYLSFITQEVHSLITKKYRVQAENRTLIGSSFGGHFALFSMWSDNFFTRFASMSTAYWVDDFCLFRLMEGVVPKSGSKIWMDMGAREGWDDGALKFKHGVEHLQYAESLVRKSVLSKDLKVVVDPEGIHNESSWAKRTPEMLRFLFPNKQKKAELSELGP